MAQQRNGSDYSRKDNASFTQRAAAFVIDATLLGTLSSMLSSVTGYAGSFSLLYFLVLHQVYGFTPGKYILGLRVIHIDEPSAWRMFIREGIGRFISLIFLGAGYLSVLFGKSRLAWHDRLSGTRVITLKPMTTPRWLEITQGLGATVAIVGILFGIGYYRVMFTDLQAQTLANYLEDAGLSVKGGTGNLHKGFHFDEIKDGSHKESFRLSDIDIIAEELSDKKKGKRFKSIQIKGGEVTYNNEKLDSGVLILGLISVLALDTNPSKNAAKEMQKKLEELKKDDGLPIGYIESVEISNLVFNFNGTPFPIDRFSIAEWDLKEDKNFTIKHIYVSSPIADIYFKNIDYNYLTSDTSFDTDFYIKPASALTSWLKQPLDLKGEFKFGSQFSTINLAGLGDKFKLYRGPDHFSANLSSLDPRVYLNSESPVTSLKLDLTEKWISGILKLRSKEIAFPMHHYRKLLFSPLVGKTPEHKEAFLHWQNLVQEKPWLDFDGPSFGVITPTSKKGVLRYDEIPLREKVLNGLSLLYTGKQFRSLSVKSQRKVKQDARFLSRGPFRGIFKLLKNPELKKKLAPILNSSQRRLPSSNGRPDLKLWRAKKKASRSIQSVSKDGRNIHIKLSKKLVKSSIQNLPKILQDAKAVPYVAPGSGGEISGFRMISIKKNSIYQVAGLKSGDVVLSANGKPLRSPQEAMEMYGLIKSGSGPLILEVLRDKRTIQLKIEQI